MADDVHAKIEEDFTDYHEKSLPAARAAEVAAHLADCARCQAEYAKYESTISAISGLHKMAAPQDFGAHVTSTIHKRSAGRFFGRRAFGDRVPFELIAVVGLLALLAILWLARQGPTGSVHQGLPGPSARPDAAPGARDVMPRP